MSDARPSPPSQEHCSPRAEGLSRLRPQGTYVWKLPHLRCQGDWGEGLRMDRCQVCCILKRPNPWRRFADIPLHTYDSYLYGAQAPCGQEVTWPLAGSPRPAACGAGLWSPPRRLQSVGHLLGLLEILLARAPEDEASGDFSDGCRNTELCGDPEDAIFHV